MFVILVVGRGSISNDDTRALFSFLCGHMILNSRGGRTGAWALVMAGVCIGWAIVAVMSFEAMVEWAYQWWKSF
jgi:hypothetical protein